MGSLGDLLGNHRRLKAIGIVPFMVLHHGGTLSAYYVDPDRIQVELFIDVLTSDLAIEYMGSPAFAANPIGSPVDIDELADRYERGEPISSILEQPPFDEQKFAQILNDLGLLA